MIRFCLIGISLLALSPIALAKTDLSLYGRVDVSYNSWHFDKTHDTPSAKFNGYGSDASLIGIRGNADLNDDYNAFFKFEHGFQLNGQDAADNTYWDREAFVGLSNRDWGSIQVGDVWTVYMAMSARTDPFTRFGSGSFLYLLQGANVHPSLYGNSIQYSTPNLGGLTAKGILSFGDDDGNGTGKSYSGIVEYTNGPLYTALGYDQGKREAKFFRLTGPDLNADRWMLGATYDLGTVKLHAWYQDTDVETQPEVQGYMLGISVPFGSSVVKASYTSRNAPDATLFGLGYEYHFTKTTTGYIVGALLQQSSKAKFPIGPTYREQIEDGLPGMGQDGQGLQVGIRQYF